MVTVTISLFIYSTKTPFHTEVILQKSNTVITEIPAEVEYSVLPTALHAAAARPFMPAENTESVHKLFLLIFKCYFYRFSSQI